MATGRFPDDPGNRRAVLVLREHDIEKCAYEPGAAQALLDEEAYVLPFPIRMQGAVPLALRNILDGGFARPGNILVQSPYNVDAYEEAALAPERFALAKHMYFSKLCMLLGAKEVVVEQIELRTRSGKSALNVKGERPEGSAQVTVEREELDKFRAQMHLRDQFEGGPADIVAAEQLLRQTGLLADPKMQALVEMRRDHANRLKMRELVLSLSSEAKSNLNVVGRLKVPTFVRLSAEYDRGVKEQHDYTLTAVVRF